jgi:hypothetical protein
MKFSFILLIFCFWMNRALAQRALAQANTYTDDVCDDYQKIAGEFIEMELSGLRWQGVVGIPACLGALKPEATTIDRIPASDPSLLDPEFTLPEGRDVSFSAHRIPNDLIDVVLNYIGQKNKKDVAVKDHFILKINFGKSRDLKGCASWYSEPDHFVMRAQCWKS